jgi:hypothetical protein
MRKLVVINDDEILYTDKEIEKSIVVITREYINVTTNDKTFLMPLDSVIKNNELFEYENMTITAAQEIKNLMQNKIHDFKFTHDISNVKANKKIEYSEKDIIEYIWLENPLYYSEHTRVFEIIKRLICSSFDTYPIIPDDEQKTITISSPDDYKKLINMGYNIRIYTSIKQFKKDIVFFIIRNKKIYGLEDISDDDIYFNIMLDKSPEPSNNPYEDDVFKKISEILEKSEDFVPTSKNISNNQILEQFNKISDIPENMVKDTPEKINN